jgi:predicted nucleic acid-binding protein
MTALAFVDTNVLVYARDRSEADKQRRAAEWMAALWDSRTGRVSYQVLQEYYVTATRKLDPPRCAEDVREDVWSLRAWKPQAVDYPTLETAWRVQDRYGLSWWDALVVASAVRVGARWLLTEDLQDGQDLLGVTVVDPFRHAPEEVLGT